MKNQFNNPPLCEECYNEVATSFSSFSFTELTLSKWKFTGDCTTNREKYWVDFNRFFYSEGSVVEWIVHLSKKQSMDWDDFFKMLARFKDATGSRGEMNQACISDFYRYGRVAPWIQLDDL